MKQVNWKLFPLIGLVALFSHGCDKELVNGLTDPENLDVDLETMALLQKGELYYWSGNKKIKLTIDTSAVILLPIDSSKIKETLKEIAPNSSLNRLRSGYYYVKGIYIHC